MMAEQITQTEAVKLEINKMLDAGITNRKEIYTKVVETLGIPRPSVRRISAELRDEFQRRANILSKIEETEE